MTLAEMRDEILSHQFSEAKYSAFADDQLNRGQAYLAAQADFRELYDVESYTTTAADNSYALPTDFLRAYTLEETTDDRDLTFYEVSDFDLLDSTSTGSPTIYTVDRDQLKLYPTPDAAYSLDFRHYRLPATLTADSDEPEIPSQYHHIIVRFALVRCFERENDYTSAAYHDNKFVADTLKMRGELQQASDDDSQPKVIGGAWDAPPTDLGPRWP